MDRGWRKRAKMEDVRKVVGKGVKGVSVIKGGGSGRDGWQRSVDISVSGGVDEGVLG